MEITSKTLKTCLLFWAFAADLCAASSRFQDEKNFYFYYSPYPTAVPPPSVVSYGNIPPPARATDPPIVSYQNPPPAHANVPPSVSFQNPPPAHANDPPVVSYQNPPPAHENNPPSGGGNTPPVHHTPDPRRHGHGGYHHHHGLKPPTNCGTPPTSGSHKPNPSPPSGYHYSPPSRGGGGGGSSSGGTPTTPSNPPVVDPPSPTVGHNPSPPKDGCSCRDPPSSTPNRPIVAPSPTEHHNPSPTPPTGYHYSPPPIQSTTPPSTVPSPPSYPNIPLIGGTCDFWRRHPRLLSDLFGWWRNTTGRAMGLGSIPGFGSNMDLQGALSNTRTDGISALYREGTASLLNSMVNKNFPFTTSHVRDSFVAALASNKVAAAQAEVFKLANEGHLKPRV